MKNWIDLTVRVVVFAFILAGGVANSAVAQDKTAHSVHTPPHSHNPFRRIQNGKCKLSICGLTYELYSLVQHRRNKIQGP